MASDNPAALWHQLLCLLMNPETTRLMDFSKACQIMDDVILGVSNSWHILVNTRVCSQMEAHMHKEG